MFEVCQITRLDPIVSEACSDRIVLSDGEIKNVFERGSCDR